MILLVGAKPNEKKKNKLVYDATSGNNPAEEEEV